MPKKYSVEVIKNRSLLDGIWQEWRAIQEATALGSSYWMKAWWSSFQQGLEPYIMAARDDRQRLCGILPLYRRYQLSSGHTLRGMGDTAVCTDYRSIVSGLDLAERCEVAELFGVELAKLSGHETLGWDQIVLEGVSFSDTPMNRMIETMRSAGATVHAHTRNHLWRLDTNRTWEKHLSDIGRNQRRNHQRYYRVIEQTPGITFQQPSSPDDVTRMLDVVIRLHQKRWIAEGQPGTFGEERIIKFAHQVAQSAFQIGRLHLKLLLLDGVPMAGEMGLRGNDSILYMWTMGRETGEQAAQISCGTLLTLHTVRHAYESGTIAVDFLRGDEGYKQRLHATPTPCAQYQIGAPRISGQLRFALWRTQFELTQFLRRQSGRKPIECLSLNQDRPSPAMAILERAESSDS